MKNTVVDFCLTDMNASKAILISQIHGLGDECAEKNWDCNGASAVKRAAVLLSEAFVLVFPDGILLPECAPEPDGSISLDWIQSRSRLFSVSVSASGWQAFAWLDGGKKGHETALFDGKIIPPEVLEGVKRIANPEGHSR